MGVSSLRLTVSVATLVLAATLTACGEEGAATAPVAPLVPPVASEGFTVGWVPDGFELDVAIEPKREPVLSEDSVGGVEPFLVVAPEEWSGDPDEVVFVALVDGSGNQGGLEQAVPGYPSDEVEYGADRWRFPEGIRGDDSAGEPSLPRQVIVRINGDRGLRVHSADAPMEVIDAIAELATLEGDLPTLTAVPRGWELVSHLDGAALENLGTVLWAPTITHWSATMGARGAHVRNYVRDQAEALTVATIDGSEASLVAAGLRLHSDGLRPVPFDVRVDLEGERRWIEHDDQGTHRRELTTLAANGSLLHVAAAAGDPALLPSRQEMARVAQSVVLEAAAWEAELARQATAPPEVDEGRSELARGHVGDVEWLLQTRSSDRDLWGMPPTTLPGRAPDRFPLVDPVLHLTGGRSLRPGSRTGTDEAMLLSLGFMDDNSEPPFTAWLALVDDRTAEVAVPSGAERVPTSPVPGGGRYALVVGEDLDSGLWTWDRFDADGRRIED